MSALEKAAWVELAASVAAVAVVAALFLWLGNGATGAFGLLGSVVFGVFFLRQRDQAVVVDERDREIERRATRIGVEAAWMGLFLALIAVVMWASFSDQDKVGTSLLTWLVFAQFAVCYGVKGLVSVVAYRRQRSDA